MTAEMYPRRCKETIEKDWSSKSVDDIINDVNNFFIKKIQEVIWPQWSNIPIECKEYERLKTIRENIQLLYEQSVGYVVYLGYEKRKEGKFDRWYIPSLCKILEIRFDTIPFTTPKPIMRFEDTLPFHNTVI